MNDWKAVCRAVVAAGILSGPALAGDWADITPRRTGDYDLNKATGYCNIRVRVDTETIIHVRGDRISLETIAGRPSTDAGTECSQPLPAGNGLSNFKFRGVDGRGEQTLLEAPSAENSWTAKIRIRDSRGGDEGYTSRIEWENRGGSSAWDRAGWRGPSSGSTGGGWGPEVNNNSDEFNGTVAVSGRFEMHKGMADVMADITEARVDLRRNGDFVLEMRGNNALYDLGGRWTRRGNTADLEVTKGFRNSGANGRGTVEFQGNQIVRLSVNGVDVRANNEFRADLRVGGAPNSGWGNSTRSRAFSGSSSGSGSFWVTNGRQMSLSEARLDISANGDVVLAFRGQGSPAFYGRVENQTINETTIRVTRLADADASGIIRVQLGNGQIERAEGQVRARAAGEVNVNFYRR